MCRKLCIIWLAVLYFSTALNLAPPSNALPIRRMVSRAQRPAAQVAINPDVSIGEYDEAIEMLKQSLAVEPNDVNALEYLGNIYEQADKPVEALGCFGQIAKIDPSRSSVYGLIGSMFDEHIDDKVAGFDMILTALELEANNGVAWLLLGILHHTQLEMNEAKHALRTAVALRPSEGDYRRTLAKTLRKSGLFAEAFEEERRAEELAGVSLDPTLLAFAPNTLAGISRNQSHGSRSLLARVWKLMDGANGRIAAQIKRSGLLPGTPGDWIERLRRVHVTRVATVKQCQWAIKTAEAHAAESGGWDASGHHDGAPTNDIIVGKNSELRRWLQTLLIEYIWPAMEIQFGIDRSELWLEDCFLVKYESEGQAGLDEHRDDSELSFNLLLSDPSSFEGGGTAFPDADPQEAVVQPLQGEMITHFGKLAHEGKPVISGAPRYIIAGFVRAEPLAKAEVQHQEYQKTRLSAVQLVSIGKHDEAIELLNQSLALVPNNANILEDMGVIYELAGQPVEALSCYGKVTKIEPTRSSVYVYIGSVLDDHMDDKVGAVDMMQKAIEFEPDNCVAWYCLGTVHHNHGELNEAYHTLRKAVELRPDDRAYRLSLARTLRKIGSFEESFEEQLRAEELAGDESVKDPTLLAFAPNTLAKISRDKSLGSESMFAEASDSLDGASGRIVAQVNQSGLPESTPRDWIERLRRIHVTRVATAEQCQWAIEAAEAHAAVCGGWDVRGHHDENPTTDIIVGKSSELRSWFQMMLIEYIWPAIETQYGIDRSELWLEDCFVVKYEAEGQAGLGIHRDDSELSFNLLLSDPSSFEGGGTAFPDAEANEALVQPLQGGMVTHYANSYGQGILVQPSQGEVITHFGKLAHEGKRVVSGAPRYIIAGFVRLQPLAKAFMEQHGNDVRDEKE